MGAKTLIVAGLLAFLAYKVYQVFQLSSLPELDENKWWGSGKPAKVDESIRPFKISVPSEVLEDLKQRLNNHRPLTPPLEGIQQQYGINTNLVKKFVNYWKTDYDWKKREAYLNKYPQFKTNIQGLDIHYLHVKPKNPGNKKVLPILLLHGWPGSVLEFYELIPYLIAPSDERDFVFEAIVPSLPGYGFSQGASKPGLGGSEMAVVFKNLMERIGFPKFYAQGGDFGALILQNMAVLYPNSFLGFHSNFCLVHTRLSLVKTLLGSIYPQLLMNEEHVERLYPLKDSIEATIRESGYFHLQATKPDTLGVAMNDSPVGLAAYILEKFTSGTNMSWQGLEDGGLPGPYTMDTLLDNVMIYWINSAATTSFRLYAETFNKAEFNKEILRHPVLVPTACARFSHEIVYPADGIIHDIFKDLVQVTDLNGGHFAALQIPEILAKDVISAVEKTEQRNSKQ